MPDILTFYVQTKGGTSFLSISIANVIINVDRYGDQKNAKMLKLDNGNGIIAYYSGHGQYEEYFYYRIFTTELEPISPYEFPIFFGFYNCYNIDGVTIPGYIFWAFTGNTSLSDTTNNVYIRKLTYDGLYDSELVRINTDWDSTFVLEKLILDELNERIIVCYYRSLSSNHETRDYFIRHYDYELNALSEPINFFSYSAQSLSYHPDICKLSSDKLILVINTDPEYFGEEIRAKYFDFWGENQSDLFLVNDSAITQYYSPNVAHYDYGVLISWAGFYDSRMMIQGKRIDSSGQFIDENNIILSHVNEVNDGLYQTPNSTYNYDSQTFAIAWSHNSDGTGLRSFVRFFDNNLEPITDTIRTQLSDLWDLSFPKCLFTSDTEVVVYRQERFGGEYQRDIVGSLVDSYTGIDDNTSILLPTFDLSNYPNPFNSQTKISYGLQEPGIIRVTIYNILGQVVDKPVSGYHPAGTYEFLWDASDLSSGLYFYKIQAGEYIETKKMMLVK